MYTSRAIACAPRYQRKPLAAVKRATTKLPRHAQERPFAGTADDGLEWKLYVARCALAGLKTPTSLLRRLGIQGLPMHYCVLLVSSSSPAAIVLDFLPKHPQRPSTVLSVLLGKEVPGRLRFHRFPRPPAFEVQFLTIVDDTWYAKAHRFNSRFVQRLRLGENDCVSYTTKLVKAVMPNDQAVAITSASYSALEDAEGAAPDVLEW